MSDNPYRFENFYELITFQAKKRGKKVALFVGEEKIRYRDILNRADALAATLAKRGVGKGDKVALMLRNGAEFVYAMFAVSKLGAVIVTVNTFLKGEEVRYILDDSDAVALIASSTFEKTVRNAGCPEHCRTIIWEGDIASPEENEVRLHEALKSAKDVAPADVCQSDTAVIFYTSGTTGRPKGAMLSYRNILSNAEAGRRTINVTARDRAIVFLPMFHAFTFSIGIMLPLYVGASIVIIPSIKPFSNIFKQTLLKRVTIFFGVPDVYNALVKAKLPWYFMWFNRIRAFISGAAPLQGKTLEGMARKFKRATLLEGYGLSEAAPAVCMNTFEKQKAGSVGTALWGYEMKVVDSEMNELPRGEVGDIIVRGDNVMQGYYKRPEATAETIVNGWLLTGDMGYMDEEGFLFIVDRKKDLIISKGINIYPREIEEVINRFEGVNASAVVGQPDENSGEIPVAYIELDEEVDTLDIPALKAYLRKHLANYKIPKHIHIVEELPKNATGKVLKRVLKEQLRKAKG